MAEEERRNIRVVVRVRPNNRRELEINQRTIIKIIDNTTLLFDPEEEEDEFYYQGVKQTHRDITKRVNKKLSMEFDRIFDPESTNEDVFVESTKPLVESVMNGYNCSVFVYGATGAGKTFTMLGSENYPGITFLTMKELFDRIMEMSESRKFEIGISYLEVYNEQVMNLLTKSGPLKLREDTNGVVVSGLVLTPIHSAEELISLLIRGNKNRTQHPTDANAESSRSHAIFQVHIRMTEKKTGQKRTVKLSMIDLAGSERAASTKGIGLRFKEGASINKSLLALGNCINKLADGLKHIPYRDSNLTRILKDSLGGNCQTLMIANISPSSLTFEDTYNTLKYASRAKKIRTTIRQNIMKTNMPKDYYVRRMCEQTNENEKLKETIKQLEMKLVNVTKVDNNNGFDEVEYRTWTKKIDAAYSPVIKAQECYYGLESKEKLLKLRAKQKDKAEMNKKALSTLDASKIAEGISRMEASIDRFGKQIASQQNEMDVWKKRYGESVRNLEKLRTEIKESKYAAILNSYLKGKDREIEISKLNIQLGHMRKVQNLDHNEMKNTREMLLHSFEILERNYFVLSANKLMDKGLEDMQNQLIKMTNLNGQVKFNGCNDQEHDEINDAELNGVAEMGLENEILTENYTDTTDDCSAATAMNNKRKLIAHEDDNGILKKKSSNKFPIDLSVKPTNSFVEKETIKQIANSGALFSSNAGSGGGCNLNETQVISQINFRDDPNSTFLVPATTTASVKTANNNNNARKIHTDILKNILTDSNVNARNGPSMAKALMKSNVSGPSLLSRFAAVTVNKENKKFSPNKIRKSPRNAMHTVTSRVLNSAAKNFMNRQHVRSTTASPSKLASAGRVRLNRAASMRTKK